MSVWQVGVVTAGRSNTGWRVSTASPHSCPAPATTGTPTRLAVVTPVAKGASRWASTWITGEGLGHARWCGWVGGTCGPMM